MAWDSSRPVPWKRLATEWVVIAVVVGAISFFVSENHRAANYLTIIVAGPVYVGFGAVVAKFGYARKTVKELRAETEAELARKAAAAPAATTAARPRPAPTSRTASGPSNRPNKKKR